MKLRARAAVVVLSFALVAPSSSLAGPPTAPPLKEVLKDDALAAFDHGSTAFGKGLYSEARADFERAFALSREPRVLYNVAVCDKSLKQYARAAARLRESLTCGGDALPDDYRALVQRTLELLDPYVGPLSIDVNEAGSEVFVDGELVGRSPLAAAVPVDVGEHVVAAKHDGFADATQKVDVLRAGTQVRLSLVAVAARPRAVGTLRVVLDDARGEIVIDGAPRGAGEISIELPPGEHKVRVRRGTESVYASDVLLSAGESKTLSIQTAARSETTKWLLLGGAVAVVTAGVLVTVAVVTAKTQYKGSSEGTLQPGIASASFPALVRF